MASNFDFLKDIDIELFNIIEDAQKLFRDEYFNQCAVQLRIFGEVLIKKIINCDNSITFDEALNNFKDKVQNEREKELVDDLFFIKQQGNLSAHGEDTDGMKALECIKRAFEVSINYAYFKKKDKKIDKLIFDETLLITQKPQKEEKLVDKYINEAKKAQEELLKQKEADFKNASKEEIFKDKNIIKPKKKKELTPKQQKIKSKVKEAKKNLKQKINQKPNKKKLEKKKNKKYDIKKLILFLTFVTISIFFITKMLFFF